MASLPAVTEPAASAVPGGMPAAWLRDDCPGALCRDPVSGPRLLHITGIPADIAVADVIASPDTVQVIFAPDGHRAVFDRIWLARHGAGRPPGAGRALLRRSGWHRVAGGRGGV